MVTGGDDYELLFTAPEGACAAYYNYGRRTRTRVAAAVPGGGQT